MMFLGFAVPIIAIISVGNRFGEAFAGFAAVIVIVILIAADLIRSMILHCKSSDINIFTVSGLIYFTPAAFLIGTLLVILVTLFLRKLLIKLLPSPVRLLTDAVFVCSFIFLERKLIKYIQNKWQSASNQTLIKCN